MIWQDLLGHHIASPFMLLDPFDRAKAEQRKLQMYCSQVLSSCKVPDFCPKTPTLCISGQVTRASDLGTQVQLIVSDKEEVKRSIQAFQRCQ